MKRITEKNEKNSAKQLSLDIKSSCAPPVAVWRKIRDGKIYRHTE